MIRFCSAACQLERSHGTDPEVVARVVVDDPRSTPEPVCLTGCSLCPTFCVRVHDPARILCRDRGGVHSLVVHGRLLAPLDERLKNVNKKDFLQVVFQFQGSRIEKI